MTTPHRIRELRIEKGITQEALAKAIGKDRTTVVRYENGESGLSLAVLTDIARALQVKVSDIIAEDV